MASRCLTPRKIKPIITALTYSNLMKTNSSVKSDLYLSTCFDNSQKKLGLSLRNCHLGTFQIAVWNNKYRFSNLHILQIARRKIERTFLVSYFRKNFQVCVFCLSIYRFHLTSGMCFKPKKKSCFTA